MSNKEYDGMKQLKEAELEAAKIEQEAKQGRLKGWSRWSNLIVCVARAAALAEAREQAKKEVEEYRAEKEAVFQEKKEMVDVSLDLVTDRLLELDRRRRLRNLALRPTRRLRLSSRLVCRVSIIHSVDYENNHKKMLDLIVDAVLNVNPHIPEKKKRKD